MYDYVTTKPELNEEILAHYGIIEHGYLKDAAAKTHKYLKRWKNAAGKWVYQYASEAKNGVNSTVKKVRDKNLYERVKYDLRQGRGKRPSRGDIVLSSIKGSSMKGDKRYKAPDPTKKSVKKYNNPNTGLPWTDLQFRGYQSSARSNWLGQKYDRHTLSSARRRAKNRKAK